MTCLYMHVSSRKKESLQGMMFVLFLTFCFQSLKWCKWQAGIETVWIHAYKQPIWRRQQNTLLRWIIWIKFQTQKMYDAGSWQCYGYIHMYIYIYIYVSILESFVGMSIPCGQPTGHRTVLTCSGPLEVGRMLHESSKPSDAVCSQWVREQFLGSSGGWDLGLDGLGIAG